MTDIVRVVEKYEEKTEVLTFLKRNSSDFRNSRIGKIFLKSLEILTNFAHFYKNSFFKNWMNFPMAQNLNVFETNPKLLKRYDFFD